MVDYKVEFEKELGEVEKLIETPNLMKDHALGTLNRVYKDPSLSNTARTSVDNGIKALQAISDETLKANYQAIYNQCCVLAVSLLAAKLEKYFINFGNGNWEKIDVSKKGGEVKFSLSELAEHGYNIRPNIAQLIRSKDSSISFQDLRSIKRSFQGYFSKNVSVDNECEKSIIFYQQCRHNIVHQGGVIDE